MHSAADSNHNEGTLNAIKLCGRFAMLSAVIAASRSFRINKKEQPVVALIRWGFFCPQVGVCLWMLQGWISVSVFFRFSGL
jgi:hypothetical protein